VLVFAGFCDLSPEWIDRVPGNQRGWITDDGLVKFKVARRTFPQFDWSMWQWQREAREWSVFEKVR
jgi:hypothetical protein